MSAICAPTPRFAFGALPTNRRGADDGRRRFEGYRAHLAYSGDREGRFCSRTSMNSRRNLKELRA